MTGDESAGHVAETDLPAGNPNPALIAARLVEQIGEVGFFDATVGELERAIPHEFCVTLLHQPDKKPQVLFDGLTRLGYGAGLQNYLSKTYRINPFFVAFKTGLQAGFHRMEQLSRDHLPTPDKMSVTSGLHEDDQEEIGFVTKGWPRGMKELLLAVPLSNGALVEFSISQKREKSCDDRQVADWFQHVVPVFISAVRKHCQIALGLTMPHAFPGGTAMTGDGFNTLSDREMDVVNLILAGHGSEAVGLHLEIALPTVKSHRRNIYRKLGISSQAELFALAARRVWHDIHPLG